MEISLAHLDTIHLLHYTTITAPTHATAPTNPHFPFSTAPAPTFSVGAGVGVGALQDVEVVPGPLVPDTTPALWPFRAAVMVYTVESK